MRRSTRQYKADLEELADGYWEARDEEFDQQFRDFLLTIKEPENITEDDIQGFIDSFDFPSEDQWAIDEYESRRDSFYDAKYEEYKERDIR